MPRTSLAIGASRDRAFRSYARRLLALCDDVYAAHG
jgi:hypothetical protein